MGQRCLSIRSLSCRSSVRSLWRGASLSGADAVQVDDTVSDMLEEWDAKLRREAAAVCESHGFVTGFLEWDGGHSLVDSYELKVTLKGKL